MSTTKAILQEIQTVLKADATLKAATYVSDRVYLGSRRNAADLSFPLIFVEPDGTSEVVPAYPKVDGTLRVLLACYTRAIDLDAQLVGDANYKGILELEKDVKAALGAKYPDLGVAGLTIEFTFPRTEFGVREDLAAFPVRAVLIEMELHYRTDLAART